MARLLDADHRAFVDGLGRFFEDRRETIDDVAKAGVTKAKHNDASLGFTVELIKRSFDQAAGRL